MGQIFSWFRGSNARDEPGLRNVSVQESQSGTTPKATAPVSQYEKSSSSSSSSGSNMASKPSATGSDVTTTGSASKVQVETPAKTQTTKQAAPPSPLDPLDALASSLPSEAPKRPEPKYKGPEVKEGPVTSEKGVRVGEREDTLPPGYRLKDMAPVPADFKPADVPKPMSTDDALDELSSGFTTHTAPQKVEKVSAAPKVQSSAPSAPKKSVPAAPPVDKKAKLDSEFPVSAAATTNKTHAAAPPKAASSSTTSTTSSSSVSSSKAQTVKAPSMDSDALGALEDLLPVAAPPKPDVPLRPDQLVKEATVEEEEGVRVGEREDSIPPEYRLKPEERASAPPLKPELSLDSGEALDFLSGDLSSSSAPCTQSAAPAPAQKLPSAPLDKKPRMEKNLEAGVTSSSAPKVNSAATKPEAKSTKPKDQTDSRPAPDQGGDMSLDALGALEDLLPVAAPPKPDVPLRPDQLVKEATVEEEEGVRVGEREDSIPPEYRLKPEERGSAPPLKPELSLDTGEALDFLSGDFSSSSAPCTQSAAPARAKVDDDFALDSLSGDFLALSAAPTLQSSACPPQDTLSPGADSALDDLSDSLKDIAPEIRPEPPMPTKVITEKKIEEERLIKMGEREDTLPPGYRLTEEELKKLREEKNKIPESPKESMDDKTALDLLAGDFSSAPAAPAAPASSSAPVCSAPAGSQKPMPGKTLESLSDTLVPKTNPKPEKSKAKSKSRSRSRSKKSQSAQGAVDLLPSKTSSDVLPTSTKKS